MTQEEKQLLLKDLCARLPYGVKVCAGFNTGNHYTANITAISADRDYIQIRQNDLHTHTGSSVEDIRPYLRPMSSMTEEEKKIMRSCGFELIPYDTGRTGFANIENCIDEVSFRFMEEFLNSHHFDYRGLIPVGLALEAKERMYKID